ncbi:MAG TPA: flagellar basal body rod protein FlgC [Stellaceae bacterium]|jgi:flagellar basal-body rod protein FlgC|nr:flagellar basal body rod protein FlgC [Stellaceae bacterium]
MSLFGVLNITGTGMAAEAQRLSTVASNIANANSTTSTAGQPYRAREVVFRAVPLEDGDNAPASGGMAGVQVAGVVESAAPFHKTYDPTSSFADASGYVQSPNVNPVDEMMNMISAQQDYQANLEAFNVAKSLALRTLSL